MEAAYLTPIADEVQHMTPVFQDKFGLEGNCFSACVATLLDLPLGSVPYFMDESKGPWWGQFCEWCAAHDLLAVWHDARDHYAPAPPGYSIIGGETCSTDPALAGRGHACIAHDGDVIFDPNPHRDRTDGTGIKGHVWDYITLERV